MPHRRSARPAKGCSMNRYVAALAVSALGCLALPLSPTATFAAPAGPMDAPPAPSADLVPGLLVSTSLAPCRRPPPASPCQVQSPRTWGSRPVPRSGSDGWRPSCPSSYPPTRWSSTRDGWRLIRRSRSPSPRPSRGRATRRQPRTTLLEPAVGIRRLWRRHLHLAVRPFQPRPRGHRHQPAAGAGGDRRLGPVVAVIDTGITNHPDLGGRVLPGYNFISNPATAGSATGRARTPPTPATG